MLDLINLLIKFLISLEDMSRVQHNLGMGARTERIQGAADGVQDGYT